MKDTSVYHSPFDGRYTSKEMNELFSDDTKFSTWRKLWVALAKAEKVLGLDITDEQIAEMEKYVDDINYDVADAREKEVRHDVMAHVYAFGQQAKSAEKIIHLGATSCYVTDNTDIILMREALHIIRSKLLGVIMILANFARTNKDLPTLGYTHYQPATPTTVGKRATLWLQNFIENLKELDFVLKNLKMLGCRGATGSSETFMKLFEGKPTPGRWGICNPEASCRELDVLIAKEFGFSHREVVVKADRLDPDDYDIYDDIGEVYPVSGQTYPRNLDYQVLNCLAAIGASAHKMAQDIRLLQHDREIQEPFSKNQIGSSAMAYKRNPMRCERICSISKFLSSLPFTAWNVASTQMLERSLDDSAARRMYIPDGFRATDAILILLTNVAGGLVINKGIIRAHLDAELPFMATEAVIMKAVEKGASRQEMHARIREISLEIAKMVEEKGLSPAEVKNQMIDRIVMADDIPLCVVDLEPLFNAENLIGRCPGQVDDYLRKIVDPLLEKEKDNIKLDSAVKV